MGRLSTENSPRAMDYDIIWTSYSKTDFMVVSTMAVFTIARLTVFVFMTVQVGRHFLMGVIVSTGCSFQSIKKEVTCIYGNKKIVTFLTNFHSCFLLVKCIEKETRYP